MARPKGFLDYKGSLAGISSYTDKRYGKIIRTKGGPSKEQISTLDSFAKTRKNNSSFGNASIAGKLLRQNMDEVIQHCGDNCLYIRVQQRILQIIHATEEKDIMKGNFKNFGIVELDVKTKASTVFQFPIESRVETEFVTRFRLPKNVFKQQPTHCKIISVLAGIDFDSGPAWYNPQSYFGEEDLIREVEINHSVDAGGILFHGFCRVGYVEENGAYRKVGGGGGITFVQL